MDPIIAYNDEMDREGKKADTIASAIEINRPVNLKKCLRALEFMNGVVRQVSDQEILDAKAKVGAGGFGCEPASAASVAVMAFSMLISSERCANVADRRVG